jgi:hypothetical protein
MTRSHMHSIYYYHAHHTYFDNTLTASICFLLFCYYLGYLDRKVSPLILLMTRIITQWQVSELLIVSNTAGLTFFSHTKKWRYYSAFDQAYETTSLYTYTYLHAHILHTY